MTTKERYVDEFYESIRAPQFFDFCGKEETKHKVDSWFATKTDDKYDESSEEEEDLKFSNNLLPDAVFDAQTPPKTKARSRFTSTKTKLTACQPKSTKPKQPSERALQMLEKQRAMTKQLKARRRDTKPIVAPKMAKKIEATTSRTNLPLRSSIAQPKQSSSNSTRISTSRPTRTPLTRPSTTKTRQSLKPRKTPTESTKGSEEFIFRALPLDRRVLESCGDMGVPKIAKLPITRPVSPKLSTARRSTVRRSGNSSSGDESNRSSHDSDSDSSNSEFNAFDRQAAEDARQVRRRRSIQESKPFQLHTAARASSRTPSTSNRRKLVNKTPAAARIQNPISTRTTRPTPNTKRLTVKRTSTQAPKQKSALPQRKANPLAIRTNENSENNTTTKRITTKQTSTRARPLATRNSSRIVPTH